MMITPVLFPLKNLENTINLEYCNESLVGDINGNNIIDSGELSPIEIQLYSDFVNDGGTCSLVRSSSLGSLIAWDYFSLLQL